VTCVSEGELRAYLDDEVSTARRAALERHLSECAGCSQALARLERLASVAETRLASVSLESQPDLRLSLANIRARMARPVREGGAQSKRSRRFIMERGKSRFWRPVLVGVAIVALFVGMFSFAPTRALARQLLSIFRVRKFAIVQISPDETQFEQVGRALEESLFIREPEVIVDEPAVKVSSIEEASELAGFQVRMPRYLGSEGVPEIQVKGRSEFAFHLTRDALVMLLQLAGMDPAQVPTGWDEATIRATVPAAVGILTERFQIGQVLDPTVEYPEGLDPRIVGEAGLRLLGLSPKEAQRISESIDWTNTLLLPIPADVAGFQELEIAGEEAVLLRPRHKPTPEPVQVDEVPVAGPDDEATVLVGVDASAELSGREATLLWEKDGVLYFIVGYASTERLVQIAESMF